MTVVLKSLQERYETLEMKFFKQVCVEVHNKLSILCVTKTLDFWGCPLSLVRISIFSLESAIYSSKKV